MNILVTIGKKDKYRVDLVTNEVRVWSEVYQTYRNAKDMNITEGQRRWALGAARKAARSV